MGDVDHGWYPPGVVARFRVVELVEDEDALELADGGLEDGVGRGMDSGRGMDVEAFGRPRAHEEDDDAVVIDAGY